MSKIRIIIGLIIASLVIATATSGIVLAEPGKITLCHFHAGDHPFHTITVGEAAVDAHVEHGDLPGACENGYH